MSRNGGIASGIVQRRNAMIIYYADPKICAFCGNVIEIPNGAKIANIRKKNFCDNSCSARFNNGRRVLKIKPKCTICKRTLACNAKTGLCRKCITEKNHNSNKPKSSVKKTLIAANARDVMKHDEKKCSKCGYARFVEICHKMPIRDFPDSALVKDINHRNNLILLCPNCHWEFDHPTDGLKL